MIEKEMTFGQSVQSSGTLPAEDGFFPSVLLLPGSGQGDRDGNGTTQRDI
jgi:hypothetical protein